MPRFTVEHTVFRTERVYVTVEAEIESEAKAKAEQYIVREWPDYLEGELTGNEEWYVIEVDVETPLSEES